MASPAVYVIKSFAVRNLDGVFSGSVLAGDKAARFSRRAHGSSSLGRFLRGLSGALHRTRLDDAGDAYACGYEYKGSINPKLTGCGQNLFTSYSMLTVDFIGARRVLVRERQSLRFRRTLMLWQGGQLLARLDGSNGYERVAQEFLAVRGSAHCSGIGVPEVREWARTLPNRAPVIDLGCGPGLPITKVLVEQGLNVFVLDASPTLVQAFRHNFPDVPIVCETVQNSRFFGRTFEGVLAWGLMFLLPAEDQCRLIQSFADILKPGGRVLFTSPMQPAVWKDEMTGLESRSLGAQEYRTRLSSVGLCVTNEYDDAGQNHYFDAVKLQPPDSCS